MKLVNKMKHWLKKGFELGKFDFEKIIIEKEVINAILELARMTSPKEFVAFLEGRTESKKFSEHSKKGNKAVKKTLRIYGLAYQEYIANEHSTLARINFPITSKIVGSVHSHPGPNNHPSRADLQFFSKRGIIHLIISSPYTEQDIQGYNSNGNKIGFEIEG